MAEINNVIAEASQDLQAIEDFVNLPADSEVYPRLLPSVNVGTLAGTRDAIFRAGGLPAEPFATKALMTASTLVDGKYAQVTDDTVNNGLYVKEAGTWVKSAYDPLAQAKTYTDTKNKGVIKGSVGKNLFNPADAVVGEQYSPSANKIITQSVYRRSGFIPIVAEQTYTLTGALPVIAWYATDDASSTSISNINGRTVTAPAGANFAVFNITNTGGTDTSKDALVQFELGATATQIEPYTIKIDASKTKGINSETLALLQGTLQSDDILESSSFNMIDPTAVDYIRRYSTAKNFATDTLGIAASDWIPVKEGEWYALSGAGAIPTAQGGYFTAYGNNTALDNITFVKPVDNNGYAFKVPTGLGITHVVVALQKLGKVASATSLNGDVQLELGEMATPYKPYNPINLIKSELLPTNQGGGGAVVNANLNDAAWYKYTSADGAKIHQDKLPKFRKSMLLKDRDLCVVMTGTSLTARTSEHCTTRSDASTRPPMMHSNAFCSLIWDALKWDNQQYRRYDAASTFTETGAFLTSSSLPEWDDGAYRDGLTRYSAAANAAVSFTVPIDTWQFNFIYRTDSIGCEAKVTIAEGVGKMQVYDGTTSAWVEAHNYAFSMLEAAPVTRSVNVPDVITGAVTATTLASKGNTTYQKRLKMRCRSTDGTLDSLASVKTVTISRTGGGARFMYWGVEHSPREFMVTYINSSRGSHNTSASGATGLPRYQDNEVWSFKPDLILSELAIHNDGAGGGGASSRGKYANLTKNYVDDLSYELSLFSRALHFSQEPEYAFFMGSTTWNFGGINDDGTLKLGMHSANVNGSARMMSSLDRYQEAVEYLRTKDIIAIDTAKRWIDAANAIFGNLKVATLGSGKDGDTLTNEGSHWNDAGSKIMAKAVIPII